MKRFLSVLALSLFALSAFAAEPAVSDQAALVAEMQRTEARFLKSIEGLSEAQWKFKAAPDRWSVAECAEHIIAAESFIRGMIVPVLSKDATPEMVKEGTRKDEMVTKAIVDRTTKFKAPEPLIPTNKFADPATATAAFKKERAETIALTSTADLRTHADKHFAFGNLDAYGWFLFLSSHSERHTLQIDEVKAHADFPKN
jgi:hypothetical protein